MNSCPTRRFWCWLLIVVAGCSGGGARSLIVKARKLPPGKEAEELVRARQANVGYLTGAIMKQGEFFHRVGVDEYQSASFSPHP